MARTDKILSYQHSCGTTQVYRNDDLPDFNKKTYILCDDFFKASISADFYLIAKEENKSLDKLAEIITDMLEQGVGRDWDFVTIGGGMIGDLGGFIASTYMRGLRWLNVPTTLLSQVDSCLGGKTGVNLAEGKNLIGSIYQPHKVFLVSSFLQTLCPLQVKSGWGEIIKYSFIEKDFHPEVQVDLVPIDDLIHSCLKIKAKYIELDEFDRKGARALLNYGHTLAHGIEKISHYEVAHGEAVVWGILFEQFLITGQLDELIAKYEPLSQKIVTDLDASELIVYLRKDKKGALRFFNGALELVQLNELKFTQAWKEFTSILKTC